LSKLPIGAAITFSHKVTISNSRYEDIFKKKGFLYNYLLRWLLERVTVACRDAARSEPCALKIVFSRRGGTDYQTMKEYLELMRDGREKIRPARNILWNVLDIDLIAVENHTKWAGLQIADCITSAFFNAVEPNIYGNYETGYALALRPNLIKRNGIAIGRGVTPVPSLGHCALDDAQKAFFESFKC